MLSLTRILVTPIQDLIRTADLQQRLEILKWCISKRCSSVGSTSCAADRAEHIAQSIESTKWLKINNCKIL